MKTTDTTTNRAIARNENNVTLRKDFIRCWLHAHPRVSQENASALYDEMQRRFPNMTRGGHRGMVGRLKPWETVVHECPCCARQTTGIEAIKSDFGLRVMTYETKTKGTQRKVYFQSQCPTCRNLTAEEKRGNGNIRINPDVEKFYTNQSDAIQ